MPKIKTRRAAAKRFRVTGSGKIMRKRAMRSHLLEWKPSRKTRKLRRGTVVDKTDERRVRMMLPSL